MWDIPISIIGEAIYNALVKIGNYLKDRPKWRGNIEDLIKTGIYEDKVWESPISIEGTFSEFVPFVNFSNLLPNIDKEKIPRTIGTCRLSDSVINGKYVGAIYLPDECESFGTSAVPIFYDNSIKNIRKCSTGMQVKLICRVRELDFSWKRILYPKDSYIMIKEDHSIPFGLDIIDVKVDNECVNEFWIDLWNLYDYPNYSKFVDLVSNISEQTEDLNVITNNLVLEDKIFRVRTIERGNEDKGLQIGYGIKEGGNDQVIYEKFKYYFEDFSLINYDTGTFMNSFREDFLDTERYSERREWLNLYPLFLPMEYEDKVINYVPWAAILQKEYFGEILNKLPGLYEKKPDYEKINVDFQKLNVDKQQLKDVFQILNSMKKLKPVFHFDQIYPEIQTNNIRKILRIKGII